MGSSYGLQVSYRRGARGRILLNDLPVFRCVEAGAYTEGLKLDPLLMPGPNLISIELSHAAPLEQSFLLELVRAGDDGSEVLERFSWPEGKAALPEARANPPLVHELRFEPAAWTHVPVYRDAAPRQYDCEGTPEQRDLIERLQRALAQRDLAAFLELFDLRTRELYASSGNDAELAPEKVHADYREFFAREIDCRPLDMDQLHFEARRGGGVCHVTGLDSFAIEAIALSDFARAHPEAIFEDDVSPQSLDDFNQSLSLDLLLVWHEGAWRILR